MKNRYYIYSLMLMALILVLALTNNFSNATSRPKANDAAIKGNVSQLRNVAELVYDDNDDRVDLEGYEGFCVAGGLNIDHVEYGDEMKRINEDILKNNNNIPVVCYSTKGEYCMQAFLRTTGGGWCADSTGYNKDEDYCDSLNYDCAYNEGEETALHDTYQILYEEQRVEFQKEKQNEYIIQLIIAVLIMAFAFYTGYLVATKKILRQEAWRASWGKLILTVILIGIGVLLLSNGAFIDSSSDDAVTRFIQAVFLILFFIPMIILELARSWLGALVGLIIILIYFYFLACLLIGLYKGIKSLVKK